MGVSTPASFGSILSNMTKLLACYATDTMADWEFAYLTTFVTRARHAKPGICEMRYVGDGTSAVHTLGGLKLKPDVDIKELDLDQLSALVIPGGDTYATGHESLLQVVRECERRGIPVAAICGGTLALARAGVLDDRQHTSNAPIFLSGTCYRGAESYSSAPAVADRAVITASGIYPVQFTATVLREVDLFSSDLIDSWEKLYLGDPDAFPGYMKALDDW